MKTPMSVKIDVPAAISTTIQQAILFDEANSSYSLLSGLQLG